MRCYHRYNTFFQHCSGTLLCQCLLLHMLVEESVTICTMLPVYRLYCNIYSSSLYCVWYALLLYCYAGKIAILSLILNRCPGTILHCQPTL